MKTKCLMFLSFILLFANIAFSQEAAEVKKEKQNYSVLVLGEDIGVASAEMVAAKMVSDLKLIAQNSCIQTLPAMPEKTINEETILDFYKRFEARLQANVGAVIGEWSPFLPERTQYFTLGIVVLGEKQKALLESGNYRVSGELASYFLGNNKALFASIMKESLDAKKAVENEVAAFSGSILNVGLTKEQISLDLSLLVNLKPETMTIDVLNSEVDLDAFVLPQPTLENKKLVAKLDLGGTFTEEAMSQKKPEISFGLFSDLDYEIEGKVTWRITQTSWKDEIINNGVILKDSAFTKGDSVTNYPYLDGYLLEGAVGDIELTVPYNFMEGKDESTLLTISGIKHFVHKRPARFYLPNIVLNPETLRVDSMIVPFYVKLGKYYMGPVTLGFVNEKFKNEINAMVQEKLDELVQEIENSPIALGL